MVTIFEKALRIMNGQIGQHLPVNHHIGLFHAVNQTAVGYSFIRAAALIRAIQSFRNSVSEPSGPGRHISWPVDSLRGRPQKTAPGPEKSLAHFKDLSSLFLGGNASFYLGISSISLILLTALYHRQYCDYRVLQIGNQPFDSRSHWSYRESPIFSNSFSVLVVFVVRIWLA